MWRIKCENWISSTKNVFTYFFLVQCFSAKFWVAVLLLLSSSPAGAGPRCEAPARLRSLQSQGQRVYEPLRALLLCQLWEDASQRRHCAEKVSASIFAPSHNSVSSSTQLSVQMLRDCPLAQFFFSHPRISFTFHPLNLLSQRTKETFSRTLKLLFFRAAPGRCGLRK